MNTHKLADDIIIPYDALCCRNSKCTLHNNDVNNNAINKTLKDSIMGKLEDIQYTDTMSVSTEEVTETISKLKKGKSCGPDGICAEALKAAHRKVYV